MDWNPPFNNLKNDRWTCETAHIFEGLDIVIFNEDIKGKFSLKTNLDSRVEPFENKEVTT